MARYLKDLDNPIAEIDRVAIGNGSSPRPGPGPEIGGVRCGWWPMAEARRRHLAGQLRVRETFLIGPSVPGFDRQDPIELRVAPDVIVVGVGVDHLDRKLGQLLDYWADWYHAQPGIEHQRLGSADDEIGNRFLELIRLDQGKHVRLHLVDIEPIVCHGGPFEGKVGLARDLLAPAGGNRLRCGYRRRHRHGGSGWGVVLGLGEPRGDERYRLSHHRRHDTRGVVGSVDRRGQR